MNYITDKAEHCTLEKTTKKHLFSRAVTEAINHSIKKNCEYVQGLVLLINPVKFHSNCLSNIKGVVRTNFKNKNH